MDHPLPAVSATAAEFNPGLVLKRALDILGALAGIVTLLLLLPFIAFAITSESRGPVIFRQVRVGRNGRPFILYKFRTMYTDCAKAYIKETSQSELASHHQKIPEHPCYTRTGRWLSRTSLDELPQFWNILRGEMSLVGPRPCLPGQTRLYGDYYPAYLKMRPGLSGLWQVSGRNRLPFAERARLDARYVRNWSLWLDLRILARTVWVVLTQDGVW